MVFNQQLFDTEKRKFGEALALDRDAKRAKLHADNQAAETASAEAEAKKNAPPADMEKYFKPGQAIYRGERRDIPNNLTTPDQIVSHLFPSGQMPSGHSWSTHPSVANRFARGAYWNYRGVNEQGPEGTQSVNFVLHSNVDPSTVSFDSGQIPNDEGEMTNWSGRTGWRERHSGGYKGHGEFGEEEIIMKTKSQVPITGITMRYGSAMNHVQFEQPLSVRTTYPKGIAD